jgi:predicted DNA-binding transcriptional regulator YafY
MNRTDRLLAIVLELQAKGWQRAEDLAARFEISKRTVYRDMQALSESGVPVISSPGQGYTLMEGYFLPPLSFSPDEAITLLLGADYIAQTFDEQYQAAAMTAQTKIEAALSDRLREQVRFLQSSMRFIALNPLESSAAPITLPQIRRAIIQRKTIRFDYHTRYPTLGQEITTHRDADPYALIHIDKAWYLVGYCHLRQDMRHFRLERIHALRLLDQTFTRPDDFMPVLQGYDGREVTVRVLVDLDTARWIAEEPSYFQTHVEDRPDGVLLTLKVRHESDVVGWLMRWGSKVRVLEPDSLRERIADEAAAILRQYQTADSLLP